MRPGIRRLVLDIQPLWLVFVFAMGGEVLLTDTLWLGWRTKTLSFLPAYWAAFAPAVMFQAKMPTWRLLPLSRRQIGRALWWAGMGAPLIVLTACLLAPFVILSLLGQTHANGADVLALLAGQWTVCFIVGLSFLAVRLAWRRFGRLGLAIATVGLVAVSLTSTLARLTPTPALRFWMIAAGLAALGGAAVIYRIGALSILAAPLTPLAERTESKARLEGKGATGWSALFLLYGRSALIGALCVVATDLIVRAVAPITHGFDTSTLIIAIFVTWIATAFIPMSIRNLGALPIGCLRLALVLQGMIGASAILTIGSLALLFTATHQDSARLPAYFVVVLGLSSLRLPMQFRLGAQSALILTLMCVSLLPVLILIAPSPVMVAAMVAAGVGWGWTYWELSRGRHAYRQRPMVAARWRGPMG
jgi:hypothetical protein